MNIEENIIVGLKSTFGSALKSKLIKEEEVCHLRSLERSLIDELNNINNENKWLSEQLQMLQQNVSKALHQVTLIDICLTTENNKIKSQINSLHAFEEDFTKLFEKEDYMSNLQAIQSEEKVALKEKEKIQKKIEIDTKNYQQFQKAVLIENECKDIEQECAVLKDSRRYLKSCQDHVLENADFHETTGHTNLTKQPEKRNAAIMLKLRRKLLETENTRKELAKEKTYSANTIHNQ